MNILILKAKSQLRHQRKKFVVFRMLVISIVCFLAFTSILLTKILATEKPFEKVTKSHQKTFSEYLVLIDILSEVARNNNLRANTLCSVCFYFIGMRLSCENFL